MKDILPLVIVLLGGVFIFGTPIILIKRHLQRKIVGKNTQDGPEDKPIRPKNKISNYAKLVVSDESERSAKLNDIHLNFDDSQCFKELLSILEDPSLTEAKQRDAIADLLKRGLIIATFVEHANAICDEFRRVRGVRPETIKEAQSFIEEVWDTINMPLYFWSHTSVSYCFNRILSYSNVKNVADELKNILIVVRGCKDIKAKIESHPLYDSAVGFKLVQSCGNHYLGNLDQRLCGEVYELESLDLVLHPFSYLEPSIITRHNVDDAKLLRSKARLS